MVLGNTQTTRVQLLLWSLVVLLLSLQQQDSITTAAFVGPPQPQPIHSSSAAIGPTARSHRLWVATTNNNNNNNHLDKPHDDLDDATTLQALQTVVAKVTTLSRQLTIMERKLQQNRISWMREKSMLVQKIALLTSLLETMNTDPHEAILLDSADNNDYHDNPENQNSDQESGMIVEALERELTVAHEQEGELLYEQERLEREVGILQNEMVRIRNLYRTEQYRVEELEQLVQELQQSHFEDDEALQAERTQWEQLVQIQASEIESLKAQLHQARDDQHRAVLSSATATTAGSNGKAKKNGYSKQSAKNNRRSSSNTTNIVSNNDVSM